MVTISFWSQIATDVGHVVSVAATHYSHSSAAQNLQGQVSGWLGNKTRDTCVCMCQKVVSSSRIEFVSIKKCVCVCWCVCELTMHKLLNLMYILG